MEEKRRAEKPTCGDGGGIEKGKDLSSAFFLAFLAVRRINGGQPIPGMGMKSADYRITAVELAECSAS